MDLLNLFNNNNANIAIAFQQFVGDATFPCVGAKSALAHEQIEFHLADSITSNKNDVEINSQTGELRVEPPLSKAGDYIVLEAKMDLVIGLTACSAGAGSEAVHAWDPKYSISEAYSIIFAKQRLLFQIAATNRKRGHKPIGLFKLAKLHFDQQSLIKRYPLSN